MNIHTRNIFLLLALSFVTVYSNHILLHTLNLSTETAYRDASLRFYELSAQGKAGFPYQWRIMATWTVSLFTKLIPGVSPLTIDAALKVVFLFLAVVALYTYTWTFYDSSHALVTCTVFLLLVVFGLTQNCSIYYQNDLILTAGFFWSVFLVRQHKYYQAALIIAFCTFAKEVTIIVVLLVGMRFLRHRARLSHFIACIMAFIVPWIVLRTVYPAEAAQTAYWHMFKRNIPFLAGDEWLLSVRSNLKVALFFNVLILNYLIRLRQSHKSFEWDALYSMVAYLIIVYWVGYVREVRLFWPCVVFYVPMALYHTHNSVSCSVPSGK